MATLHCIASSSAGNSFVLECSNDILVLDLGVNFKDVLKAVRYEDGFDKVRGCLVTHIHSDHSKSIPNALKYCLDVYSCQEVCDKYEGVNLLQVGKRRKIGGFIVQPIAIKHNVENYGYIITHDELGKLVYAVDCAEFAYKIKDVNHWIIEANSDIEIIIENMENGSQRSASENHLTIDECIDALKTNRSDATRNVILAHLSDANTNEVNFTRRVSEELNLMSVVCASPNMSITL